MNRIVFVFCLLVSIRGYAQQEWEISDLASVQILGASEQDNIGIQLAGAGDFNGDGIDDFVLGTEKMAGPETGLPAAYLLYGATSFPQIIDLLNDRQGITRIRNLLGRVRVAHLGDFDADGYDDILFGDTMGSPNSIFYAGQSFIMFGTSELPYEIDVNDLALRTISINGYRVRGVLGWTVSGIGDVNGDGFDDALISDVSTSSFTEADAYLIYGGTDAPRDIQTPEIGSHGVRIRHKVPLTGLQLSVAGPGDVNGDGFPDLLIGSSADGYGNDYAFLIYGGTDLPNEIDTKALDERGVLISAEPGQAFGRTVSGAGDVNGDGLMDFMVSEPGADEGGTISTGRVYLIYGATDLPRQFDVRNLGSLGMTINGGEQDQILGQVMAYGGDLNLDGHDDPIMGSFSRPVEAAPVNVVFGGIGLSNPRRIRLSTLDRVEIDSSNKQVVIGSAVANIGDVNADGYRDLIIGERFASPLGRFSAGRAYVIFNRPGLFQSLRQRADLNQDGEVDHEDLFLFGRQWQEKK